MSVIQKWEKNSFVNCTKAQKERMEMVHTKMKAIIKPRENVV